MTRRFHVVKMTNTLSLHVVNMTITLSLCDRMRIWKSIHACNADTLSVCNMVQVY